MAAPISKTTPEKIARAIRLIAELAATMGKLPGIRDYDSRRGADLPSANALHSVGYPWRRMMIEAGLKPKAPTGKPDDSVPTDVEKEIVAAFKRGDHIDQRRKEWPMKAIPTREEIIIIPISDTEAWRITRYYASLR